MHMSKPVPEPRPATAAFPVAADSTETMRRHEAAAAVAAYSNVKEDVLRSTAATLGYDLDFVTLLAQKDPQGLADMVARVATEKAQAQRDNPFHYADLGDQGDLSRMVANRTPDQIREIARTLVPEDKKNTHTVLFDPPLADGLVYGWSVVKNGDVTKKIERGWSPVPRGALAPEPDKPCAMPDLAGIPCKKRFRTDADVLTHQRMKHASAFAALEKRQAETREAAREQGEAARLEALKALVARQTEALALLAERLAPNTTTGGDIKHPKE